MLFTSAGSADPAWWTSVTTSTGGTFTGLGPTVPAAPTAAANLTNGNIFNFSGQGILPLIALTT
jgi:hypothetical protein